MALLCARLTPITHYRTIHLDQRHGWEQCCPARVSGPCVAPVSPWPFLLPPGAAHGAHRGTTSSDLVPLTLPRPRHLLSLRDACRGATVSPPTTPHAPPLGGPSTTPEASASVSAPAAHTGRGGPPRPPAPAPPAAPPAGPGAATPPHGSPPSTPHAPPAASP